MPIARGSGTAVPPPVVDLPGSAHPIPQEADPGAYTLTWITPPNRAGTTEAIPLNPDGANYFTLKSLAGLGVAPREIATSANPDGGVTIDAVRYTQREIIVPMRVRDRQHMGFVAQWRRLGQAFAMTKRHGPGLLRIVRPDGTARQIRAVYSQGWEGEPGDGAWLTDDCAVTLLCPDPVWRDVDPVTYPAGVEDLTDYLSPYPSFGSGQVIGATKLLNPGQVDVWPTWEITGPMTSLVATNTTRNQSFTLTYALGAGQTITMSSRPIQVRGPAGQNLVNALNLPTGKPWRLDAEWTSDVTFTAAGSGPTTRIVLSFYPGYETA